MEKIKITREQEKAFKDYIGNSNNSVENVKKDLSYFIKNSSEFGGIYEPLQTFTPEQFALLLCGWYEVEQPFNVGEWVYNNRNKRYMKVSNKTASEYWDIKEVGFNVVNDNKHMYTKITEHWKIMLLELGRDKPEFKVGDMVVKYNGMVSQYNDSKNNLVLGWAKDNEIKYIYPLESRIEL